MFESNSTMVNPPLMEGNDLLLTHVRLIVKFYIWPLLVLFGLTGNCLAILVLTRRRLIRTSTNNYLTILAVSDSCYLIFTLILNFGSHATFSQNSLTQTLLFVLRPLADFSSNTATWLIVCFTLERTLAVTRPIYAKRTCSVRRSRHLISILLVICFVITLPTYFEKNFIHDTNDMEKANDIYNTTSRKDSIRRKEFFSIFHRLYLVFICVVIIWIPLTLICICNSILIWYVHRSRRFGNDHECPINRDSFSNSSSPSTKSETCSINSQKSSISSNLVKKNLYSFHLRRHSRSYLQKRKVTIVLICCLCLALILWTPQSLSLTYETLIESYSEMSSERRTILLIFNNFANLFLCINASIDFILYCFLSEKFARTCRQIIWRQCSNYQLNANQRSRMRSLDRTSFILANTPTTNTHQQQQQQLAANRTNKYYTQICHFYRPAIRDSKNRKWKKKFVQTLSTTPNPKIDNRIFYQTSLVENRQKILAVTKKQQQQSGVGYGKSIEKFSNTEDDYTNNELNGSITTSISSNRQSHSNTITNI